MKIKLLIDLPVDADEGMTAGRELEATLIEHETEGERRGYRNAVWVMGDTGEKVKVWAEEYQRLPEPAVA